MCFGLYPSTMPRKKLNSKRKIWAERFMILNEVDLAIRANLESRGWLSLLEIDHPPPTVLIREFFSNLSCHIYDSNTLVRSWIWGVEFTITPRVVVEALGVPIVTEAVYPYVDPSGPRGASFGDVPPSPSSIGVDAAETSGAVAANVPPPTTSDDSDIWRMLDHVLTVQVAQGQILVDVLDEICGLWADLARFRRSSSPPPFDDGFWLPFGIPPQKGGVHMSFCTCTCFCFQGESLFLLIGACGVV